MAKRICSVVLAVLCLAAPVFAGGKTEAGAGGTAAFSAPGVFPIVKEKTTLTLMKPTGGTKENLDTNWFTKFYEDKTNVKVVFITAPAEQFKDKANLALASADPIDLIVCSNNGATAYNKVEQLKLGTQGAVRPLNDLIDKYGLNLKKALESVAGWKSYVTAPDGKIYGLPYLNECYHCLYYNKMWLNTRWTAKLGLKLPETTDEFYAVLKAFRDNDANGNGQKDEIPLMSSIGAKYMSLDGYLMSAFLYCDGEDRISVSNGKVKAAFQQPEYREGLRYLNKLYSEGLIYKESLTQNRTTMMQLNSQKFESVAGAILGPHGGYVGSRKTGEEPRWFEYIAIKPLKGPGGVRTTRYDYFTKFGVGSGVAGFLPAASKKPELAMRFIDWFYTEEGSLTSFYGPEGIYWVKPAAGDVGLEGAARYKSVVMKDTDPYYGNATWGFLPHVVSAAMRVAWVAPADMYKADGSGFEKYLHTLTRENYAPFGEPIQNLLPPLYYPVEVIQDMATLKTNIDTYVTESMARFIVGDMKVDADWDKFQKELDKIGITKYLEIVQKAYDASPFKGMK